MWPFVAVPALSPTIMCSHMLAGASATSSTIGSVVEDVETVVGASVFDALALEATIVHCAYFAVRNTTLAGGSLCVPIDSVHGSNACHGLYSLYI